MQKGVNGLEIDGYGWLRMSKRLAISPILAVCCTEREGIRDECACKDGSEVSKSGGKLKRRD